MPIYANNTFRGTGLRPTPPEPPRPCQAKPGSALIPVLGN